MTLPVDTDVFGVRRADISALHRRWTVSTLVNAVQGAALHNCPQRHEPPVHSDTPQCPQALHITVHSTHEQRTDNR